MDYVLVCMKFVGVPSSILGGTLHFFMKSMNLFTILVLKCKALLFF